ncbi:MAG: aquaporin [Ignavibacteriales bacterium]|nr:aquaporin [Ignavibacteriales bacterium]
MNPKAWFAEFIGTFTLIFAGVGSIAADHLTGGALGLTGIALAHGLAIGVMISATMSISGGHLNPAVTVGALTAGKIDWKNAAGYVIAQCLGALVASYAVLVCVPSEALHAVNFGTPALARDVGVSQGLLTEIILTFFLMFVVYGTAIDKRAPKVGGLFIGLTVTLGVLVGGPITGGAMNPARHLGPALASGLTGHLWLYWVGPLVGAVIAATAYRNILEESQTTN